MSNLDDKYEEIKDNVKEEAEKATDKAEEVKDNAKASLGKTVDEVKDGAHKMAEEVKQSGEAVKEKLTDVKEQVKTGFDQTVSDVIDVTSDDKNKAVIMHVLSIFFGFISPLIFYFAASDNSAFLKEEARRDLNFQITITIAYFVSGILMIILIGIFLAMIVGICALIFEIIALIKSKDGEHYKFPLSLNLIK